MKNLFSILITLFFVSTFGFSQVLPWDEGKDGKGFKPTFETGPNQLSGDAVSIYVTNQGSDINDCILKAQKQALYQIIFIGMSEVAGASGSPKITDISDYSGPGLKDKYIGYLTGVGEASALVFATGTLNVKKPAAKIDKKTIQATTTVVIDKALLMQNMASLGFIKSASDLAAQLGYMPSVLIVPSDTWMKRAGFMKVVETSNGPTNVYDYVTAMTASDNKEMKQFNSIYLLAKENLSKSFIVKNLEAQMAGIQDAKARNSMRSTSTQESDLDLLARVVSADIWIKVDLEREEKNAGRVIEYRLTYSGIDPMTMTEKINGKPQYMSITNDDYSGLIKSCVNSCNNDFLPKTSEYYKKKEINGLDGLVMFQISTELSDVDFNSEMDVDGDTYDFATVIGSMMSKVAKTANPEGAQTPTSRAYSVSIVTKVEDKLSGKIEANNYEKFAKRVKREIEKLTGYKATVETLGLGKVIVIFTEKKN